MNKILKGQRVTVIEKNDKLIIASANTPFATRRLANGMLQAKDSVLVQIARLPLGK